MFYVSEINHAVPETFENETQKLIYEALGKLGIPFDRVTNDYIVSMDDCVYINEKLGTNIVKNLFLCNRQETEFYLYVTRDNKRFKTKIFSKALGVSRLSFAPEEALNTIRSHATTRPTTLISASQGRTLWTSTCHTQAMSR